MYGERDEEHEKELVVSFGNAIANPRTVMIHRVDAGVAHAAVRAAWRPKKLTRGAPFHAYVDVIYEHVAIGARVLLELVDHLVYVHLGKAARIH